MHVELRIGEVSQRPCVISLYEIAQRLQGVLRPRPVEAVAAHSVTSVGGRHAAHQEGEVCQYADEQETERHYDAKSPDHQPSTARDEPCGRIKPAQQDNHTMRECEWKELCFADI